LVLEQLSEKNGPRLSAENATSKRIQRMVRRLNASHLEPGHPLNATDTCDGRRSRYCHETHCPGHGLLLGGGLAAQANTTVTTNMLRQPRDDDAHFWTDMLAIVMVAAGVLMDWRLSRTCLELIASRRRPLVHHR
jgi:hypothetical protein